MNAALWINSICVHDCFHFEKIMNGSGARSNKEILGYTIFKYSNYLEKLKSQSECLKISVKSF